MTASSRLPLKNLFSKFAITVDRKLAEQIIRWKLLYETRDSHAEALNTPFLGVAKIGFFNKDQDALFNIVGIEREEFKRAIKQSSINTSFKVASDEFNLLTAWVVYNLFNSGLPEELKSRAIQSVLFMLQCKFFSSLVRHYLPYGAKESVMEATIDSLSDKFDIKHKETSTWKLVIEARAAELMDPSNIHWNALRTFTPDAKVVYILTDVQTRIRTKFQAIINVYFEMVKTNREIASTSLTMMDKEKGHMVMKELENSFDGMTQSVCNRVLNAQQFIRADFIKIISKLMPNAKAELVRNLLMQFTTMATVQYQKKTGDNMTKDGTLFAGYHILISNLIQRTYRECILSKVNLQSRLDILYKTINMYSASRINDPAILQIKDSVSKIVVDAKLSSRDATNTSLKIALIVYFILMTFDCD